MPVSPLLRKAALIFILLLTIGFTQRFTTTVSQGAAIDSPLPTLWPTVVVTYQATLPTARPTLAATVTAVASNFFRSPLPTPTTLPNVEPPQTVLSVQGAQNSGDWYRSPVTPTFALTDNIAAGVTEYQLAGDATWTTREYYYPPVTLAEEGMHTLAYRSLDWAKNRETAQSAQTTKSDFSSRPTNCHSKLTPHQSTVIEVHCTAGTYLDSSNGRKERGMLF